MSTRRRTPAKKTRADFDLPEGWTYENLSGTLGKHQAVICRPEGYRATVDFERRCFRAGHVTSGPKTGPDVVPTGKGWKQTLVGYAVAWLGSIG